MSSTIINNEINKIPTNYLNIQQQVMISLSVGGKQNNGFPERSIPQSLEPTSMLHDMKKGTDFADVIKVIDLKIE